MSEFPIDGATFYQTESLHTGLYDLLYGRAVENLGDIAWYDALAQQTGPAILDAACGSGRVFSALARPGRVLHAFDASPELLKQAAVRATAAAAQCPVQLSQQRLESFEFAERFDLILLPYYSFGNLLDAASRQACLQRIARHLKPGGRAVIHLPAPELLTRQVPPEELAYMRARHRLETPEHGTLFVEQQVLGMSNLDAWNLRAIQINALLLHEDGTVLKQHPATLYYACLTPEQLGAEANSAGLAVVNTRRGFFKRDSTVDTELVVVLALQSPREGATP